MIYLPIYFVASSEFADDPDAVLTEPMFHKVCFSSHYSKEYNMVFSYSCNTVISDLEILLGILSY